MTAIHDLESVAGLEDLEGVLGISHWDAADYLTSKESILSFLAESMKYNEVDYFESALEAANRAYKRLVETG